MGNEKIERSAGHGKRNRRGRQEGRPYATGLCSDLHYPLPATFFARSTTCDLRSSCPLPVTRYPLPSSPRAPRSDLRPSTYDLRSSFPLLSSVIHVSATAHPGMGGPYTRVSAGGHTGVGRWTDGWAEIGGRRRPEAGKCWI